MSRLEFRAAVAAPRPPAAWLMVLVAGATLWITRQLDPLAVAAQAAGLALSFRLRRRPHVWQKRPLALNAGMLAVVAVTVAVALRGEPSTLALAHFAALTQVLQLLDARPRRTEFLLVALALFQVILAANLTDSVFFFPLLAVFVVSTTWTLIVHTLRTEAAEAGMPDAVTTAITPGLLRTALLASGLSLALALLFFLALPRMRSSLVEGPGFGRAGAAAGFSDRVELGDLGRIRQDATLVLRVETLRGEAPPPEEAYWRGIAFDGFDGRRWSVSSARRPLAGSAELSLSLSPRLADGDLVQRIVREPVSAGVIFAAGEPVSLQGDVQRVQRDGNGALYAPAQAEARLRYVITTHSARPEEAALAVDVARLPAPEGERYLGLPHLREDLGRLAREITAAARSDAERARALEGWLRRHGRYDDRPPGLPPGDPRSPVEIFLRGGMAGHCEYFATAMVVLARALGLPARLVNGFAGGRENTIGGFVELTRSDAHAWVEIHYARAGWVAYDPTPPDLRLRPDPGLSLLARLGELGSAVELWWFQRVVDFDRSDQFRALRAAFGAWQGARGLALRERRRVSDRLLDWHFDAELVARATVAAPSAVAAVVLLGRWLRRRRRGPPILYDRALRLLARRGLARAPAATAREFALLAGARLPPAAASSFAALTESYLAERFGGRSDPEAAERLRELRRSLRRRRGGRRAALRPG
jgi:hypothetical protein